MTKTVPRVVLIHYLVNMSGAHIIFTYKYRKQWILYHLLKSNGNDTKKTTLKKICALGAFKANDINSLQFIENTPSMIWLK